ncbi:MAG TPA: hypothetical protein VEV39_06925 [Gemmatimonadales bacterium]|nr:hypothetical protein [Gemmatimonadales bacterium]
MIELRVNTLTALPALQYMLADAGLTAPHFSFRAAWDVFQKYLAVPSDAQADIAGFQTTWVRENALDPVFEIRLCRQVTDAKGGWGSTARVVGIDFRFEGAPAEMDEVEIWASDVGSLKDFIHQVEASTEFQYALRARLIEAEAIVLDEGDPQEVRGGLSR